MHNECMFVGRLGKDPDCKVTESGAKMAQFNIACDEPGYTTKDGKEVPKRTEWIPVVVWGNTAENAGKYLRKGSLILVVGKFRTRTYDKDGITFYRSEIYADSVKFLEPKKDNVPAPPVPETEGASGPAPTVPLDTKDDLPF